MLLRDLISQLSSVRAVGAALALDAPLSGLHSDSRWIGSGDVFAALPGIRNQGVDYLRAAFDAGAVAALVPSDAAIPTALAQYCIRMDDMRGNTARAACAVYGNPTEKLLTIGVTGTNGKTSTCHIVKYLLESAGHRVVMLSTVAHEFEDWHCPTPNTTPDAPVIQAVLARAVAAGASAAVLEVSAHGVLLQRIDGCRFDGLIFTNLAVDHQDFFDGLEPYFAAKRQLFINPGYHKPGCVAAIGVDDEFGRRLYDQCRLPTLGVGAIPPADVSVAPLQVAVDGLSGRLTVGDVVFEVNTTLASSYNRANLGTATALAMLIGLPVEAISRVLVRPIQVPGRLMRVPSKAPFQVIVDYAHTDSALHNLLTGLRAECQGRLIVVFGAGGDKDPLRRHSLPRVVIELARVGVITLDNPRSEPPQSIIDTMVANWRALVENRDDPPKLIVEADRRQAIERALDEARADDIVVLAGKGHENTQIFANRVEEHDDYTEALQRLSIRYG